MSATASDRVTITVDGRTADVARGTTILNAARQVGIAIPTLCNLRGLPPYAACRVCLVELETPRGPRYVASCSHPAEQGSVVHTDTQQVRALRQTMLELMLAQAPESHELAEFAVKLGVRSTPFEKGVRNHCCEALSGSFQKMVPDTFSTFSCVLCGLCVRVCGQLMGRGAVNMVGRGAERKVAPAFGQQTDQCQACGACEFVCPTGARKLDAITARTPQPHRTGYNQYLEARPNIDLAHPQASPRIPVIDRESCVHFKTGACGLCAEVCQAKAIDYEQQEETLKLDVGSVVLTPGFEAFDATRRGEFGYSFAPNVLSNVQFERLLSASGPTGGHVLRPSDRRPPRRLCRS
jgi:heterodisulfide reductase subunit A